MHSKQEHHLQFFTAVCKEGLPLLQEDTIKHLLIEALQFRIQKGQVKVCSFVIMPNHIHLIWRVNSHCKRDEVQRDFLKFTGPFITFDTSLYYII
jgi:REP element-mobilizing transposase RayT